MASKFKNGQGKKKGDDKGLFSKKNMMSFFIVAVMIASAAGYMVMQNADNSSTYSFIYNGILFKQDANTAGITATIDGQKIVFQHSPQSMEQIDFNDNIIPLLKNARIAYITSDAATKYPADTALASFQLNQALNNNFNIYAPIGLTTENSFGSKVVTCLNATQSAPVIYFIDSNRTKADISGSCIILESNSASELSYLEERIIYGLYGIVTTNTSNVNATSNQDNQSPVGGGII